MLKQIDYWKWSEMSYATWLKAVNHRFTNVYLASVEDLGIAEENLRDHWEHKEAPYDFVEWFALKYDLDPKPATGF